MATAAEKDMAICVSNRVMEVVNVAKNILETLEQLESDGNQTISMEPINFVREAQRAIASITDNMYFCRQAMTEVMDNQSLEATNTFEVCTSVNA